MTTDIGRCPSGRAAAADAVEPSSTVSSKADIPNAWIPLHDALYHWANRLDEIADECGAKGRSDGIYRQILIDPAGAGRLALLLRHAASAIEAQRAETAETGSVADESAASEAGDAR